MNLILSERKQQNNRNLMKKNLTKGFLAALLLGSTSLLNAQTVDVDRTKYPDYSEVVNPDWSLMTPQGEADEAKAPARNRAASQRPDHVHNGLNRYFPPVFNQQGGSCGSASRICYMFSYEMAAYRDLDGSQPENNYPSHFVWLHTNSPGSPIDQGKDAFVTQVGVPSSATYGGQTYSSLFGYQEESNNDFGWMQGYDKWYEAMHNRMLKPSNFPVSVATEEGREAVKNWLWNHNGDESFQAGGICGIGVASACETKAIPDTEKNRQAGTVGMEYVMYWGEQVDHALTIVGYDDRIEFDLDGNGIAGEVEKDEVGAWIIVNSWGAWWKNNGFVYCPYAQGMPTKNSVLSQNAWQPEIYRVRKDYRPLRAIKLEMDYSRRSEIALSAGISADLTAEKPEKSVKFVHFTYAGDGNYGNSNPAPEIPMLGRWADGELHTEPMEFGYDLTDLTEGYDMSQPLKYFFIVDSRSWAQGNGTIHGASILDYRFDELGVETPFAIGEGVEIKNKGEQTIISVIVQGGGYNKPQNAAYADGKLTWQAPLRSAHTVAGYNVYFNGSLIASLKADVLNYQPSKVETRGEYGVSAVYSDGAESDHAVALVPVSASGKNQAVIFKQSGFTIPGVMTTRYENATIEFWIKPKSLSYWNQTGGPGWGTFMFHADGSGAFTAGWDTSNRTNTDNWSLSVGSWTHVAIVVERNKMSIYLNGKRRASCSSGNYSGVGGFGDLVFASSGNGAQDAVYDEIRIWKTARTEAQVKAYMNSELSGNLIPKDLVAYFKGDLTEDASGNKVLCDCVGGYHATLQGYYSVSSSEVPSLSGTTESPTLSINVPTGSVYAGVPVALNATYNTAVNRIVWTAEAAGIKALSIAEPAMTFAKAGTHTVTAVGYTADGRSVTATQQVTVVAAPEPDASFTMTATEVPAGERITFHASSPKQGYIYTWNLPGADMTKGTAPSIATSYQAQGTYTVTLTVTSPDGKSQKESKKISVAEVSPEAAFSIAPAVVLKGESVTLRDESRYTPLRRKWVVSNGGTNYIVYADANTVTIDQPGVYDVTLNVSNNTGADQLTRQRALIVTNADSKNGLNFSRDEASVTARVPFTTGQEAFTIDWWMNAEWTSDNTNGIGESLETLLLRTMGGGKMQLFLGGNSVNSYDNYVVPGEWHHYAVTFDKGSVTFYRDGVKQVVRTIATTTLPAMSTFRIGGAATPFRGNMDEMRVWNSALTEEQLLGYANQPIADVATAEANDKLALYYGFNQSGGDVQDATSNKNNGARANFGPEGDAWGLSKGVFCLSQGAAATTDVTADYLTNYAKSFTDDGKCINKNLSQRTFGLTGWTLENTITNGSIITGAHVDREKNRCFTVTSGWDGFASMITDHKVFQTITLPAGYYIFTAEYDRSYEGQCDNSYLVVAEGNTLPVTDDIVTALAYTAMSPKSAASSNSVGFVLTKETTVSLGLVVNMSGNLCMTMQKFILTRGDVTIVGTTDEIPVGIETPIADAVTTASRGIYDLMGRQLRRDSRATGGLAPGIYIIDGVKCVIK